MILKEITAKREGNRMRENRTLKKLKNTAVYTGEQVKQVAKEVAEDCDNEVLRNARSFYGGIARKAAFPSAGSSSW